MGEINQLCERLSQTAAHRTGKHWIIPLHSSVQPAEQRQAFKKPPEGVRKIVVATNIAETSLTIEDVVYVVDTAKLKVGMYWEHPSHACGEPCKILIYSWWRTPFVWWMPCSTCRVGGMTSWMTYAAFVGCMQRKFNAGLHQVILAAAEAGSHFPHLRLQAVKHA